MKNIFKGIGTLFMLAVMIAMTAAACNDPKAPPQDYPKVYNYGHGVFYFPYVEGNFGKALAAWREQHMWDAGCQIITIAADDTYAYGKTDGYFVITNPSCEAK